MTIPEALKNVYKALGGSAGAVENVDKTTEMIDKVADQIAAGGGGGGASLPAVTDADNGDVLTVVEGAWGKAAPSGGGLLVEVTYHDVENPYYTMNKNYDEITGAIAHGTMPVIVATNGGDITPCGGVVMYGYSGGVYSVYTDLAGLSESPFTANSSTGVLTQAGQTPK